MELKPDKSKLEKQMINIIERIFHSYYLNLDGVHYSVVELKEKISNLTSVQKNNIILKSVSLKSCPPSEVTIEKIRYYIGNYLK
ncbi:hypothetical protein L3081_25050 [Colwellia sp. MSW7]|uniref:Uncharacterized protein n=1 Tax=Colwellia maritima TaxID=2912588 RepID=A0ABS9X784_9GAMM|nr:hypothetical protein [Colwellia maritima]MCI2286093.1 hypothetical protein [Colwellia maritima]